eukprot:gene3977-7233_t
MNLNKNLEELKKKKEEIKVILQKSQEQSKQASILNKECIEKYVKKLSVNKSKLQTIFNEVQKQLNVINNLFASLNEKNKNLSENIEKTKNTTTELLLELDVIFNKLKNIPLQNELSLISNSIESTIEKKDLFDYVNVESVETLKLQAQVEIVELDKLKTRSKDVLDDINQPYKQITEKSKQLLQNIDFINFNLNPETFNQKELKEINDLTLKIATKYDKLHYIISNDPLNLDFEEYKNVVEFSKNNQSLVNEIVLKIIDNCSKAEEKFKYFSTFYKNLKEVFIDLEKISPLIPNKIAHIEGIESHYHQRLSASRSTFEEISDLTTWYNLFLISYKQLLLEINRRNRATIMIDKLVLDVSKQLSDIYSNEISLREEFQSNYGSYLPPTLCPPIFEHPTKFSIAPEKTKTSLPMVKLSEEEIEDIQKNYSLEEESEEK